MIKNAASLIPILVFVFVSCKNPIEPERFLMDEGPLELRVFPENAVALDDRFERVEKNSLKFNGLQSFLERHKYKWERVAKSDEVPPRASVKNKRSTLTFYDDFVVLHLVNKQRNSLTLSQDIQRGAADFLKSDNHWIYDCGDFYCEGREVSASYTVCDTLGAPAGKRDYVYKVGAWRYLKKEDQSLFATGVFDVLPDTVYTHCEDSVLVKRSHVDTLKWLFFSDTGRRIQPDSATILQIERADIIHLSIK